MRGTITLAAVVVAVDADQEAVATADMVEVMLQATQRRRPLKIQGSSQPWAVNENLDQNSHITAGCHRRRRRSDIT